MTFQRYLGYLLKKNLLRTAIVSTAVIPYIFFSLTGHLTYGFFGYFGLFMIMEVFALLIPVLELAPLKKKRNLDTFYNFPFKRSQMAFALYISGLVQLFTIFTPPYLAALLYAAENSDKYNAVWLLLYYPLALLFGWVTYSVSMFFFNEGNTVTDGIIFCLFGTFALGEALNAANLIAKTAFKAPFLTYRQDTLGYLYTPLSKISQTFAFHTGEKDSTIQDFAEPLSVTHIYLVWVILGFFAMAGFLFLFRYKKAEKAEEISNSIFGYRTMIPFFGACLLLQFEGLYLQTLFVLAFVFLAYLFKQRGEQMKAGDIIPLVATVLFALFVNYHF